MAEGETRVTFKFSSGPAYVLFVSLITIYALIKSAPFDAYATATFGALVWYTGRRAVKEVKLAGLTMTRETATATKPEEPSK